MSYSLRTSANGYVLVFDFRSQIFRAHSDQFDFLDAAWNFVYGSDSSDSDLA